jgi:hypothetical protein
MRRVYSFRPRIEALEDRAVPATINLVAGQLFISNPTAALTVTSLGAGQVKVQDGLSSPVYPQRRRQHLHHRHQQSRRDHRGCFHCLCR